MSDELDGIRVVPEPAEKFLNKRQVTDYRSHRESLIRWLLNVGKNPESAEGYERATVKTRVYRMDQFYRWVWDEEGGYTTRITHDHADSYLDELAYSDNSNVHKNNSLKALQMLSKWRHHAFDEEQWEPEMRLKREESQPRDYFTREERHKLREAALEYGTVPDYDNLSADERDRWRAHLAQRFEKPKEDVDPADWDRANGWKIPSMVCVSLDTGLRPIEVGRAVVSWVDTDNGVLRIPKEESSKNRDNWIVGLQEKTATILERWLEERKNYAKYRDTDALWLTREGNPYQSHSLKYVLERLCEIADIDTENRKISWYAIRHSVGTYVTHEEDLGAAKAQLRHKSEQTTMKYDQAPVEERKDALERMG